MLSIKPGRMLMRFSQSKSDSKNGEAAKMPAATSTFESFTPSSLVKGTHERNEEVTLERRREFDAILPHALPRFRRMAMRWLRNTEDAEDAVQEAMLLAFRHIDQFDGRARMSTWLTAIVINAARVQIRRRPQYPMLSLDHAASEELGTLSDFLPDSRPTPEKSLEQSERYDLVMKLAGGLPPSQKAALLLCPHNGFSIRQAAEMLGVPEGTVKVRLARARANLAKRFHHATTTPKTSGLDSKGIDSFSAYRHTRAQGLPHLPTAVFREQGGREGWAGA
jgi:RNA polymerase sigma-70 factor, ECF subfamily